MMTGMTQALGWFRTRVVDFESVHFAGVSPTCALVWAKLASQVAPSRQWLLGPNEGCDRMVDKVVRLRSRWSHEKVI
jgi:hypothetical protein